MNSKPDPSACLAEAIATAVAETEAPNDLATNVRIGARRRRRRHLAAGAAAVALAVTPVGFYATTHAQRTTDTASGFSARADQADVFVGDGRKYDEWTNASGETAPAESVRSAPGAKHCGWDTMTFLFVDSGTYVEDPSAELLASAAGAGTYRASGPLPADARETGWERDGERLWISADQTYAYVGTDESVAAWPRVQAFCD